jgi:crotonobetainyl-CoA:carnitine CoA-transferase CaiB-like acyl-CoA transferase
MVRPLDGITVVSLEHAIAAPFCTRQLADLGARVIKVERPGAGDFARAYDTRVKGQASHFVWTNRSKESLTLDLKQPQALEVLNQLLENADVLVQNLAPGAAARMGLGYEALSKDHPKLIVCDISGYGDDGPLSRQEGLRPADPERGGCPVGHRHARVPEQGWQLGGRHCGRHVRLHQHPVGAAAARQDRAGQSHRCVHA